MATSGLKSRAIISNIIRPVTLILALLLGLSGIISDFNKATASTDDARWARVNIPIEGGSGNWVLASGSNVQHPAVAIDGTIYCYANPAGSSYTLFKSTDAGCSWAPVSQITDAIVDIATSPDDANIVYYATAANVYESVNAGASFVMLPRNPGGAGSGNITITAIDIALLNSSQIITVGTRDTDDSQYGGVYMLDKNDPFTGWIDTNIGSYDICAAAFSPNFTVDRQLVAVVTDETDTRVTTKIGNLGWGTLIGNATITGITPITAAIAFPDDHNATAGDSTFFVSIDGGSDNGDVYLMSGMTTPNDSTATDLNIGSVYNLSNVDITSLAVSGNATSTTLLAGAANSTEVYTSTDCGLSWTRSLKKPTGQSQSNLCLAPDFTSNGLAYAVTSGTESALSYTTDGGATWNQSGLIDTTISSIRDLAVSPNYDQDSTLFILTFDSGHTEHSLWRSLDGGTKWQRVFTSTLAAADSINLVELPPEYGSAAQTVYLTGSSGSGSVVLKSTNNGQTFTTQVMPFSIDTWAVADDNKLFLCSYNGSHGLVSWTINNGVLYPTATVVGNLPLKSIVLSPNYQDDKTLLIGDTSGYVYWSNDDGRSFKLLPAYATSPPLTGNIFIAFDPGFSSNKVVYAASDTTASTGSNERIYRFTIGTSDAWKSMDGTLPVGSILSQLVVSPEGVLYTANSQVLDTVSKEGGMERSLNPTYPLGSSFETVTRGLNDGATLTGLWLRGNQLWSIDTTGNSIMTYTDSLTRPVTLTAPLKDAPGISTSDASLDWNTMKGATRYQWQMDSDTDFSSVPTGFEGNTSSSFTRLPVLDLATTYHWRVRVTEPVPSPWSATWSFTTYLGSTIIGPELYIPEAGDTGVLINPVFQWSAIAGADSYELLVSDNFSFTNPVIMKINNNALPVTAWQSDISLSAKTTYYWKVRGTGSNSYSAWSAVSGFTTGPVLTQSSIPAEQPPTTLPAEPSSPQLSLSSELPSAAQQPSSVSVELSLPGWVIYLAISLLLIIVLLLITMLVLVVVTKRT